MLSCGVGSTLSYTTEQLLLTISVAVAVRGKPCPNKIWRSKTFFFFSGYSVEKRSFLLFFIITKCPSLKLITHCFCSESLNFCTDIFSLDVLLSAALQVMTSQELHIILFLKLHKKWQKYQLCSIQFNDFNVHRSSCSATLKNRTVLANSPFITNFKLG